MIMICASNPCHSDNVVSEGCGRATKVGAGDSANTGAASEVHGSTEPTSMQSVVVAVPQCSSDQNYLSAAAAYNNQCSAADQHYQDPPQVFKLGALWAVLRSAVLVTGFGDVAAAFIAIVGFEAPVPLAVGVTCAVVAAVAALVALCWKTPRARGHHSREAIQAVVTELPAETPMPVQQLDGVIDNDEF